LCFWCRASDSGNATDFSWSHGSNCTNLITFQINGTAEKKIIGRSTGGQRDRVQLTLLLSRALTRSASLSSEACTTRSLAVPPVRRSSHHPPARAIPRRRLRFFRNDDLSQRIFNNANNIKRRSSYNNFEHYRRLSHSKSTAAQQNFFFFSEEARRIVTYTNPLLPRPYRA